MDAHLHTRTRIRYEYLQGRTGKLVNPFNKVNLPIELIAINMS